MTGEEWKAIQNRDRKWDGRIWFAVRNGATYCRPSCGKKARTADRIIVFHDRAEAEEAGLRPCRFCHPDRSDWRNAREDLTDKAKTYMKEHVHEKFSLEEMAADLHVDGNYLLRTFHAQTGHTTLWYHQNLRCREACELLCEPEKTVGEISTAVGFSTPALFSRVFRKIMGVPPSVWRETVISRRLTEELSVPPEGTATDTPGVSAPE